MDRSGHRRLPALFVSDGSPMVGLERAEHPGDPHPEHGGAGGRIDEVSDLGVDVNRLQEGRDEVARACGEGRFRSTVEPAARPDGPPA